MTNTKQYININKKRPNKRSDNNEVKSLSYWLINQNTNYKNKNKIMKDDEIRKTWEEFITEYQEYFLDNSAIKQPSKKSTTIKSNDDITPNNITDSKVKQLSNYQELSKKMSLQKSSTTKEMFIKEPNLWNEYHDC